MYARIFNCVNGEFIIKTQYGQVASLSGMYQNSFKLQIGDFILCSDVEFDDLLMFPYAEFINHASFDEVSTLSSIPDFFLPCHSCVFRL